VAPVTFQQSLVTAEDEADFSTARRTTTRKKRDDDGKKEYKCQ
jgi:hypothetical protein